MESSPEATCIYCKSHGPFTDEHVFPAGMGGDDNGYLLIDLVCGKCNTDIFSKLELSLMRRSPTALGRKFMQSRTRDRGSNTSKPSIEARGQYILDESGELLESESDKHGDEIVLAQLILKHPEFKYTAKDNDLLEKFLISLSSIFDKDSLSLIKKLEAKKFEVSNYQWIESYYHQISQETLKTPPKGGVWLEAFNEPAPAAASRIFQKLAGQVVLKTVPADDHLAFLRSVRRTLPTLKNSASKAQPQTIYNPLIQMQVAFDIQESERALAKIGVNFIAHSIGHEYVRHSAFDKIKSSILTGTPELPLSFFGEEGKNAALDIFGTPPANSHCIMISGIPNGNSGCDIYFTAKLYGSGTHRLVIAENAPLHQLLEPTYFIINYEEDRISKVPMLEYQLEYGHLVSQLIGDATRSQR